MTAATSCNLIPTALTVGLLLTVGFAQDNGDSATNDVVAKMMQAEAAQGKNLPRYRVLRAYELKNGDGSRTVQMLAEVNYAPGGKSIEILEEQGSEGMFRRALHKVLEAEVKTSREDGRGETRLSPDNYRFQLTGTETRDGRRCYVLRLTPKRKSRFLIEGRAWIDAEDYAVVAVEGRSAACVSFWVGKPYITQSFQKVGDFWLLAHNHSTADAKIVGRIALSIETRNIEVGGTKVAFAAPHPQSVHGASN